MELMVAAAVFVGTVGIVLIIGTLFSSRGVTTRRLRQLTGMTRVDARRQTFDPTIRTDSMPTITRLLSGRQLTETLLVELSSAGSRLRPSEFVGIVAASVIVSQLLAFLITGHIISHLLLAAVGVAVPLLVLKSMQRKRRAAFDGQLVDALIMLSSSLRAGFALPRAMQMVAQEMPPPISEEFSRAINEMNVGRRVEDSLKGIVSRVKSYDFDLVVTAVLIHNQVGGNLAEVLETIAGTIRERVRVLGEVRALTAEGKLSGAILVLLPIGLGVFLGLGRPDYMSTLFSETIGWYLIGAAAFLQVIGGLWIRKMLQLDF